MHKHRLLIYKPIDVNTDESHVFELQVKTRFEVCDPCIFFNTTYVENY